MDEVLRSKVVKILEKEQKQLEDSLGISTVSTAVKVPEGYTNVNVVSTLRQDIIDNAKDLRDFCKIIDDKIISLNAQINFKKQEIVTLTATATNGNCWPGIACSSTTINGTVCSPQNIQFNFKSDVTFKNDIENLRIYPHMAGPSTRYDVKNVFEPDTIYPLISEYSGYGYRNLRDITSYKNTDGTLTGLSTDGSGSTIGSARFDVSTTLGDHSARSVASFRYYAGSTITPATCVGIANSINTIYNQILQLRVERDSLRSDLNTIKDNKKEKELAAWGINRMYRQIDTRSTKNVSAISAIKAFDSNDLVNVTAVVLDLDVRDSNSYSGVGTSWYDLSGYGNHATLFPTASPATYEFSNGGFLTFNGTDEYAQTVNKATNILGAGTTWTAETWFRINGGSSSTFSSVVSTAGTIAPLSGIITGITTTGILVGHHVNSITNIIGSGTTVIAIGIGTVYINPIGLSTETKTNQTFQFGIYPRYTNTLIDLNSSSTTTHLLSVVDGQNGIFSGVTPNRIVYTTSQTGVSTTHLVGTAITNGVWYHAAIVRNGTTNTKLYLNGVGVATYSGNFPLGTVSTTSVKIARFDDETIYSNSSISVVKIYQNSFTDDEIKNKFLASKNRYNPLG